MFNFPDDALQGIKAYHTVNEIKNQPQLWKNSFERYMNKKEEINKFLDNIIKKHKTVKVIFTGAGTSEYVGNVITPYLASKGDGCFNFSSIATTNIVSNPRTYLQNVPTILVSFARSGNSPESIHTVKLADQLIDDIYHLAITCAKTGKLATGLSDKENAYVFLMDDKTNDKAFAMTSSFSCMLLSSLLVFDKKQDSEKEKIVNAISDMAQDVLDKEQDITNIINVDFNRIVYLGSGVFSALTKEAQLKILELTAGKIATCYDSSMGFRHGPKSFVDPKTLIFTFVSNDEYTRKYDIDILNEINNDKIAKNVIAVTNEQLEHNFNQFVIKSDEKIQDVYLSLPYVVLAQIVSVLSSIKVGNTPDTPSQNQTVNRVVQGVILHDLV